MITATLVAFVVAVSIYVYHRSRPRITRNGQHLQAAPDTLPILGNAIKFLQPRHVLFDWFVQCQKRFGNETFEIRVPSLPPGVVINDPVNLEYVLKNEASITKGEFFKRRSWDLFGYGIINASGDLWKAQRKAGLKFFAGTNLDVMIEDVLPEVYAGMKATLLKAADEQSTVDMSKAFLDLTTSVVGQMAYDMEIDASSPFSRAFDHASDQIGLRFQNPLYTITELFTGSEFHRALTEVKNFGRKIVTNARTRRSHIAFDSLIENEEPMFGSLIDSLIESFRNPQMVADSALNFLSAGRDTTAQSLTWTLYALLRHPTALSNLQQEIDTQHTKTHSKIAEDRSSSSSTNNNKLTVSTLQPSNMPYTTATFYESLRLYPPVPFELKQCEKDTTLPDGTFLPRTSIVVWCIWAMNRATQTFGADAHIFRPERWLSSEGNTLVAKSAFEFPVFNGGPRACLGKKMAELMAAYVLAVLLADFEFEEVFNNDGGGGSVGKGQERVSRNSLTLPMEGGLPCRVRVRKPRDGSVRVKERN